MRARGLGVAPQLSPLHGNVELRLPGLGAALPDRAHSGFGGITMVTAGLRPLDRLSRANQPIPLQGQPTQASGPARALVNGAPGRGLAHPGEVQEEAALAELPSTQAPALPPLLALHR